MAKVIYIYIYIRHRAKGTCWRVWACSEVNLVPAQGFHCICYIYIYIYPPPCLRHVMACGFNLCSCSLCNSSVNLRNSKERSSFSGSGIPEILKINPSLSKTSVFHQNVNIYMPVTTSPLQVVAPPGTPFRHLFFLFFVTLSFVSLFWSPGRPKRSIVEICASKTDTFGSPFGGLLGSAFKGENGAPVYTGAPFSPSGQTLNRQKKIV